jgi:DNA invertase Pin-like site-specific DNA recombinase
MNKYITLEEAEQVAMIYASGENKDLQIRLCEQYAEEQGYEVIAVLTDYVEEIFDEIGNVDIILVAGLHHIARKAEEFYSIEAALAEDGIRIESPSRKIEYANGTKSIVMHTGLYRLGEGDKRKNLKGKVLRKNGVQLVQIK